MTGRGRFSIATAVEILITRARSATADLSTIGDYVAVVIGGDERRMIPVVWATSEPLCRSQAFTNPDARRAA